MNCQIREMLLNLVYAKKLVKFGCVVSEICERTGKQTNYNKQLIKILHTPA